MTEEKANDIMAWWEQQSFTGKELFKPDEQGNLLLCGTSLLSERIISSLSIENRDTVLKNLVAGFELVESKMREAEIEWLAAKDKQKLSEMVAGLRSYLNTVEAAGDFEKYAAVVADWEKAIGVAAEENIMARKKLVEMAESLAESTDWKETSQAFKDITDQWRSAGYGERGRNDHLWNRIEAARKAFQGRKRDHDEDEGKDMLVTLDLKIELAEKAESLAESTDWKSATEAYNKITEDWKSIGRTLPKKNEELWKRIMTAKNTFFERKKAHYNLVQQEQEANYLVKIALVERAEALKDSREWANTAQAFAALMEEWKQAGRVPQERSEEIWKRFSDASEYFFEARRKHTEETRVIMDSNYTEKRALLQLAEELKDSTRWSEATAEMNRIFDEWKKIGPVPRDVSKEMWESFLAARKHFFNRKDADRDQKKQYYESQKAQRAEQEIADAKARAAREIAQRKARIQQAHDTVAQVTAELKEEQEKLEDFKQGIENITPGKKAEELRKHLTTLIAETEILIQKLHGKLAKAQDELKQTEEREKQAETPTAV